MSLQIKRQQAEDHALTSLKTNKEFKGLFGASRVSHVLKVDYCRAIAMCDRAIAAGLINRDSGDEHLLVFNW
ncbi:hypothetical protein C9J27_04430 [Photobacterium kishitanii]|uniref:Uncharacterized protein n=2 Tax=Photobacterium kishitanii TaxID=318456 RepID=A0A2T3KL53_9GAMM|nr:hypothetical protein C9J27_04430 [Photobacterium kishitanii]